MLSLSQGPRRVWASHLLLSGPIRGMDLSPDLKKKDKHSSSFFCLLPSLNVVLILESWQQPFCDNEVTGIIINIVWWFISVVFLPKSHNPNLTIRKTLNKFQSKDILQNTWLVLFKTFEVIKNKEYLKNCHNREESKEIWQLNVKWCPRLVSGTEKRHLGKIKEIWINYGLLLTVIYH